jgi:DNA repair photolyase
MKEQTTLELKTNLIRFPLENTDWVENQQKTVQKIEPTPIADEMEREYKALDSVSSFKSAFDWTPFKALELRSQTTPMRGGFAFKSPFRLANAHSTCQQCLYSFEIDTYGRGCVHNCVYCYAKAELNQHGMWNKPFPAPVDLNIIRKVFFTIFETNKPNKWRSIMEKRIPIRIGSMSDSFMGMDDKYKVTKEFLKILNHYNYPYVIFTRSDLVAKEDYMSLLRKDLCAVQFSISSTNDKLNRLIEPGAPSAKRRLKALEALGVEGFWTAVRINPVFPIYPDGYFTDQEFAWTGEVPKFEFTSFDMVDEIADAKVPAILAGFGRFSGYSLNQIEQVSGVDLRPFFKKESKTAVRMHFSDKETRFYYEQFRSRARARGVQFSTCYIGNGDSHFWKDQDLWSNKKDFCNIKGKIE